MISLRINEEALRKARMQFCLDIGMSWEEYVQKPKQKAYIRKASYKKGTCLIDSEGARVYEGRNDFFHAMICFGQLFLVVDEQIYDWAVENFADCAPEWFCEFGNLRRIDEKLKEYGHSIKDTHVYMLPTISESEVAGKFFVWYNQEEILSFRDNNKFTSAICFSKTQPDMLAVAAVKEEWLAAVKPDSSAEAELWPNDLKAPPQKTYDQSNMDGMAGVSADGLYLWQIGINVVPLAAGRGLASELVRALKEEVLRRGKIPFYGTGESHTISQTVGLKAGFMPAWTEVYVK